MSKQRIWATLAVGLLLLISMVGLRHIDRLNDGIKLKEIELQDNSLRLELLDKKYIELNKELDKTGADKKKLEQDLQQLQNERMELEKALQAKKQQKANDLAVKTQRAVTGTAVASAATGSCADWIAAAGISDVAAASALINAESGCNPHAVNSSSGACGVAQELPCGKSGCALGDGACQVRWMNSYVLGRYGSWSGAWATWNSRYPHWY